MEKYDSMEGSDKEKQNLWDDQSSSSEMEEVLPISPPFVGNEDKPMIGLDHGIFLAMQNIDYPPFILLPINGASGLGKSYALNFFLHHNKLEEGARSGWCQKSMSSRPKVFILNSHLLEKEPIDMKSPVFTQKEPTVFINFIDRPDHQNGIIHVICDLLSFSSTMIYNVKSKMDETTLQNLTSFFDYAWETCDDQLLKSHHIQRLYFILRDWNHVPEFRLDLNSMATLNELVWVKGQKCSSLLFEFLKRTLTTGNSRSPQENLYKQFHLSHQSNDLVQGLMNLHPKLEMMSGVQGHVSVSQVDDCSHLEPSRKVAGLKMDVDAVWSIPVTLVMAADAMVIEIEAGDNVAPTFDDEWLQESLNPKSTGILLQFSQEEEECFRKLIKRCLTIFENGMKNCDAENRANKNFEPIFSKKVASEMTDGEEKYWLYGGVVQSMCSWIDRLDVTKQRHATMHSIYTKLVRRGTASQIRDACKWVNKNSPYKSLIGSLFYFTTINRRIENNVLARKKFSAKLCGKFHQSTNFKINIWTLLRSIMSPKMARQFHWSGRHGKISFRGTEIQYLLFDVIRAKFPRATDYDIEGPVKQWLKRVDILHRKKSNLVSGPPSPLTPVGRKKNTVLRQGLRVPPKIGAKDNVREGEKFRTNNMVNY